LPVEVRHINLVQIDNMNVSEAAEGQVFKDLAA